MHPDGKRSRLRTLSAAIDGELAALKTGAPATERLDAAWQELVRALDLGPEPDVRACPYCGQIGMRAAARCGYCWKSLPSATAVEG